MGAHLGWTVAPLKTGKWLARVKVPGGTGSYKSKQFAADQKRAATKWAQDGAAAQRMGLPMGGQVQVLTKELAVDYVASLVGLNKAASHTKDVARNMARMALAVPNLAAPAASAQIETWLADLRSETELLPDGRGKPLGTATRNKILAEARAMCRWAIKKRRLSHNPTDGIDRANVDKHMPTVFSLAELHRLLAESESPYHRLFAFMLYTGFRVQEASHMHWEDIDWLGDCVLLVLRAGSKVKGRKERQVPLQEELRVILEMPWPATNRRGTRNPTKVDGVPAQQRTGPMFAGRGMNPFRGMANFLHTCQIPIDGRSPHSCRHTYASLMTAGGLSLDLLKTYMGHKHVSTTTIYTGFATRYESVARNWPRGRLPILQGVGIPIRRQSACE